MFEKLKLTEQRFEEISEKLSCPEVVSDNEQYKALMKEYKSLEAVVEKLTEKEQSTIKKLEPELILTAEVLINNTKVSDFKGGKVDIAIDFTPAKGKALEDYFAVHIKDHGAIEKVDTFVRGGKLHIEVGHFSEYAVVEKATYDKVADEINKTETTSPTTGNNAASFLMIAALAVVFGAVSFKKLSKAN